MSGRLVSMSFYFKEAFIGIDEQKFHLLIFIIRKNRGNFNSFHVLCTVLKLLSDLYMYKKLIRKSTTHPILFQSSYSGLICTDA